MKESGTLMLLGSARVLEPPVASGGAEGGSGGNSAPPPLPFFFFFGGSLGFRIRQSRMRRFLSDLRLPRPPACPVVPPMADTSGCARRRDSLGMRNTMLG